VQICNKLKPFEEKGNGIIVNNNFSNEWINGFINCNNIKEKDIETIKTMLKNIIENKIVISKEIDREIVGCGYGVIENNFVGLFDIVVREDKRGNGFGKEIVNTIISEANKNGIEKSYLQVVNNNTIAKKLYENIGYKEYKYWYRIK
jgi:ribosomal protein S18 acetylase RimI-like enzyme